MYVRVALCLASLLPLATACVENEAPLDGEFDSLPDGKGDAWGIPSNSYVADALVRYASTATAADLTAAGVHARAVRAVTAAARPFDSIDALDAVPYTGEAFFRTLAGHVTVNGLVGRCGDATVQEIAGETCDGGPECSNDCKVKDVARFIATTDPVWGVMPGRGDTGLVSTSPNAGFYCPMEVIDAVGSTLLRLEPGCSGLGLWATDNGYDLYRQASDRSVEVFDLATGARRTYPGVSGWNLNWQSEDLLVVSQGTSMMRFLDATTREVIIERPTSVLSVSADGAVIGVNSAAGTIEQLALDAEDQLVVTPLMPSTYMDGEIVRTPEVRVTPTGMHVISRQGTTNRFRTYLPGSTTPASDQTFAVPPSQTYFIASNGSYLHAEGKNYVVYDANQQKLAVLGCLVDVGGSVMVAETATGLIVASPQCGNGYFLAPK